MKPEEVKVDLNELREFKRKNFQDRLRFIDFWVDYIKKNTNDSEWSVAQAGLIDGQHDMAERFVKNYQAAERERLKVKNSKN